MTHHQQRIVVGLDESDGGRAALTFALHEAVRRNATVEAITAFEVPHYWNDVARGIPTFAEELRETCHARSARIADEVCAAAAASFFELPEVVVSAVGGDPASVLLQAARDADLLVVGSRGRGGVAGLMLGSVSLHCVVNARCPVTVVHPAPVAAGHGSSNQR